MSSQSHVEASNTTLTNQNYVRRLFFDIPVDDAPIEQILETVEVRIRGEKSTHIFSLNPHHFMLVQDDPEFGAIAKSADLIISDGIGIKILSRFNGQRIQNRVVGSDLMLRLCEHAARAGRRVFLLGGRDGIASRCAYGLVEMFPNLQITGFLEPPFVGEVREFDNQSLVRAINSCHPDILFVALGAPKQEKWIERNRASLNAPILMGVGNTFDLIGGRFRWAPRWMRRIGFEWLFRMLLEPIRLWRRYLIGIPQFALLAISLRMRMNRGNSA